MSTVTSETIDSGEPTDPEQNLPKMSFLEHLEELRKRLLYSVMAIFVGFLLCWWKAEAIYAWLQAPLTQFLPKGDNKLAATPRRSSSSPRSSSSRAATSAIASSCRRRAASSSRRGRTSSRW